MTTNVVEAQKNDPTAGIPVTDTVVQPKNEDDLDDSKKISLKQRKKRKKKNKKNGHNSTRPRPTQPLEIDVTTYDDPPLVVDQVPIVDYDVQDFDSYETSSKNKIKDTVIVTKIQGPAYLQSLRQMLCLLHYAYNSRTKHDIVVFTSEPITLLTDYDDDDIIIADEENDAEKKSKDSKTNDNKRNNINKNKREIRKLQSLFADEGITFRIVVDNPGLHTMVRSLSPKRRQQLLQRCGSSNVDELSWYSMCTEQRSTTTLKERLAYNWQAEFRALHLWNHPAIEQYDYMMWIDADVFCTQKWTSDPVAVLKRYNLTLLFDHFPQGAARGYEFPSLTQQVFNKTICDVELKNDTLSAKEGKCLGKKGTRIHQVHGFFHVAKLDFFRSTKVTEWNSAMIGYDNDNGKGGDAEDKDDDDDPGYYRFSRLFDDQIGLTIPAAVLAGETSRDMKSMGVKLRVMHNYVLDGFMADWRGYFVPWWRRNANTSFPEACDRCIVDISG